MIERRPFPHCAELQTRSLSPFDPAPRWWGFCCTCGDLYNRASTGWPISQDSVIGPESCSVSEFSCICLQSRHRSEIEGVERLRWCFWLIGLLGSAVRCRFRCVCWIFSDGLRASCHFLVFIYIPDVNFSKGSLDFLFLTSGAVRISCAKRKENNFDVLIHNAFRSLIPRIKSYETRSPDGSATLLCSIMPFSPLSARG